MTEHYRIIARAFEYIVQRRPEGWPERNFRASLNSYYIAHGDCGILGLAGFIKWATINDKLDLINPTISHDLSKADDPDQAPRSSGYAPYFESSGLPF